MSRAMTEALMLLGRPGAGKSCPRARVAQHRRWNSSAWIRRRSIAGWTSVSAKPSAAEQASVTHHLIDIRDPAERYSAADFVRDAQAPSPPCAPAASCRCSSAGTMLYAKALRDGLSALPSADPAIRAAIDADAERLGWPALHARLAALDPETAARLAPNDAHASSGRSKSSKCQASRCRHSSLGPRLIGRVLTSRR